ncbi:MAG TPA: hypothetical protein VK735_26440, partial [Pseudonocardia sp.]|uniref:hypothetical protein n=1 Tax=Pseudonocardia sp. TaxID=60912 RepID=UPI002CAF3846
MSTGPGVGRPSRGDGRLARRPEGRWVALLMFGLADGPPPAGRWRRVASAALAKFGPDGARLPVPPAPFDVLVEVRLP